ncbi:MAG TPA: complex I NDUFA9 subunit family protein [Herpetosiphon sp.]|uniref:NAD-dependent epimerase/dehydratase n=1 Tax=Herpetosiphon aurantiacus (strain ATCC 23779 / DSM 785 / 114-95) TaxID=316274 RepID=A9AX34_HERA2|nr:complex I NDUFA9 subunit family protein [Herpetosiphon sp.]ABX04842.1 NAD-dependent epimerase/dehydratase [Herpetosiphon aurantiacus DSM 785]HBW49910.1 complex I NDUFA9 subunit family protein [Herpetosiphon sp.]
MRIFLTGASGFIGRHVAEELHQAGHQLTCLVRQKPTTPINSATQYVAAEWLKPTTWLDQLAEHDMVINCVGMLRESRQASFQAVHTSVPIALFKAAAQYGLQKIIQISALGADVAAPQAFVRSKALADQALSQQSVPWVVLRPSFVYGAGCYSMELFRRLARLPITPILGDGSYQVQPIQIGDLVRAIRQAVEDPTITNCLIEAGGSEQLSFRQLLERLAASQNRQLRPWFVPNWLTQIIAQIGTTTGLGPINRAELSLLLQGNTCDLSDFRQHFGFEPRRFEPNA